MRSEQQKLERVLESIEIVKRIEERPNPTVWSKDVAENKVERTQAGKVLSYLHDLDCIDKYFGREDANRYETSSLDLERLHELTELFKPEKLEKVDAVKQASTV